MPTRESPTSSLPGGAHAADDTLTRLIDGQLLDEERSDAAHATGCPTCQARITELRRRRTRLTELLVSTDTPSVALPSVEHVLSLAAAGSAARSSERRAPTLGVAETSRFRRPTRRTLAAAAVILSGAALAAQPVSRWVMARLQRPESPAAARVDATVDRAPAPSPAAIAFVPQPGEFTVRFDAAPASGTLTLQPITGSKVDAAITARAKDENFFVLPDGLRIRNSATSVADYRLAIPPSLTRIRVQIGAGATARTVPVRVDTRQTVRIALTR